MYSRLGISVGNLLLDINNYRIVKQGSQKGARDAIIAEQGRKLVKLAEDIVEVGMSPFDLPMVIDANDGNGNYVVIEGNRRLTAIQLLLQPELARDTPVFAGFNRLHKRHADAIPKVLECVVAPNKEAALVWINRKHANGLEGAGTEHWTAMAKARADVEQGFARPDLDVVNFVLADPNLDSKLRAHLEGASFNLTTLQRLITTNELQKGANIAINSGRLSATASKEWVRGVLTDVVQTIAAGKRAGEKFTERSIDSPEKREAFVEKVLASHPGKKGIVKPWEVTGNPKLKVAAKVTRAPGATLTPSTEEQVNLVPRKFRLELPSGKINDIFTELKKLDVTTYRHGVSVLFRVFVELSVDGFLKSRDAAPPQGKDSLFHKLGIAIKLLEDNKIMSSKELAGIKTELADKNSLISPVTLNAYVHSEWMNPDPLRLKIGWSNLQLLLERMWTSVRSAGQD